VALVVALLLAFFVLPPPWSWLAILAGGAIEVGEAGFWWRWSHRHQPTVGAEALVGAEAVVVAPCRPLGRVRVQGELWAARCDEGADVGDATCVVALDGLTLIVERA